MRGDGRVIRTLLTKLWNVLKNGTENRYISWVYRGLKCCVYLVSIILALALLLGVGHVVQYGLSAKSLSYVGSFIGSLLDNPFKLLEAYQNWFEKVWKELAQWEKATVIILHLGSAFEISTKLNTGVFGHGYYNIMGESPLEGHIKADEIHSIVFSTMPFMGLESLSVLFFDKTGRLIFSVYAGRENRQIIENIKTSFYKMKGEYSYETFGDRVYAIGSNNVFYCAVKDGTYIQPVPRA